MRAPATGGRGEKNTRFDGETPRFLIVEERSEYTDRWFVCVFLQRQILIRACLALSTYDSSFSSRKNGAKMWKTRTGGSGDGVGDGPFTTVRLD